MITFETRYDEATAKWQWRLTGKEWSAPMSGVQVMKETKLATYTQEEYDRATRWSRPIDHAPRTKRSEAEKAKDLYEVRGGKVQKIGYTAKERTSQEVDELLAALEGVEL